MVAHGRIGDEIDALKGIGMTPTEALGAASWTARDWLGRPPLEHGAPADLVCYADDPRTGAAVINHPDAGRCCAAASSRTPAATARGLARGRPRDRRPARRQAVADPNALWTIVNGQCVPDQRNNGDPAPCALVDLDGGEPRGYAVLKDLVGTTQYLLIPTERVPGIESPQILAVDAPNYFADAWRARSFVEQRAGRELPRDSLSLAINSADARSQDQLHIHVDCVRADVRQALTAACRRYRRDVAAVPRHACRSAVPGDVDLG